MSLCGSWEVSDSGGCNWEGKGKEEKLKRRGRGGIESSIELGKAWDPAQLYSKVHVCTTLCTLYASQHTAATMFWLCTQWLVLGIFVQKVFETNLNFRHQREKKIWKSKGTFVMSIFKVIYLEPLFFQISYLLLPRIEICLKYFLDKNPQKQPLCVVSWACSRTRAASVGASGLWLHTEKNWTNEAQTSEKLSEHTKNQLWAANAST
jgi:hypothetical protein